MNKTRLIRNFASQVAGEHVIIPRERDDWMMCMSDSKPRLVLPPDPNKNDEGDKSFRKNFVSRCPLAKGFANVTISILHELGHHFNREVYVFSTINEDDYDSHYDIPYEIVATDWAIEWLQNADNRKMAKAFEREYFGY